MIIVEINNAASYQNLPALKEIYRPSWRLKEVHMSYNVDKGLPPFNTDSSNYPFRAIFQADGSEIEVRIYTLTVGYGGSGPHDTLKILDFLGVSYDEDDIFTRKKEEADGYIRLKYTF